jgi:hypothetical protein
MNIPDLKIERAKKDSDLYGNKMYIQYEPNCSHTQKYLPQTTNFNIGLFMFINILLLEALVVL